VCATAPVSWGWIAIFRPLPSKMAFGARGLEIDHTNAFSHENSRKLRGPQIPECGGHGGIVEGVYLCIYIYVCMCVVGGWVGRLGGRDRSMNE
jgi:hypothetical protein